MRLVLSQFVRVIRTQGREILESIADERWIPIDEPLRAVLGTAWQGPVQEEALESEAAARLASSAAATRVPAAIRFLVEQGLLRPDDQPEDWREAASRSVPVWPSISQVELSGHCPMKCPMCAKGSGDWRRSPGFMEVEIFRKLVDELRGTSGAARPFELHNMGESLLHPRLAELVDYGARAGLHQSVSTNAAFLDVATYRQLAEAGIEQIVICLDGLDPETLESIRGPAARGAVALKNVEAVLAHRRGRGERRPHLVIQMLRMERNRHQHKKFLESFQPLEGEGLTAFLKELEANTPPAAMATDSVPYTFLCRAAWNSLAVLWDGRVVACGYDFDAVNVLGDLHRDSLPDIWRGETLAALRRRILEGSLRPEEPCSRCHHRADRWRRPTWGRTDVEPHFWQAG